MSANIKYIRGSAEAQAISVDEPISDFITHRTTANSMGQLVELLVERGVLSRREVFDVFKREEDYLG